VQKNGANFGGIKLQVVKMTLHFFQHEKWSDSFSALFSGQVCRVGKWFPGCATLIAYKI
jgi:hypothetical protein